jgi:glycine cleavage system H protein
MNSPNDRFYSSTHQWARQEDSGAWSVGITDHAQSLLGDLVFVELPGVGQALQAGESCAVVESVKTASDVFSPLSGRVLEVNPDLDESPESVNDDPYACWLWKMEGQPGQDWLTAAQYDALLGQE